MLNVSKKKRLIQVNETFSISVTKSFSFFIFNTQLFRNDHTLSHDIIALTDSVEVHT